MKTDQELLELAAKAAGDVDYYKAAPVGLWLKGGGVWSPLHHSGDALRLAVKLNIVVWECAQYRRAMVEVRYGKARGEYWEPIENDDPYAATRRAIVRAAAEIGSQS